MNDATAPLLDHRVQGGGIAVDVEGMDQAEPVRSRAFQGAALQAELALDLLAGEDPVTRYIPIEHHIAGARQRQSAALRVGDQGMGHPAPAKGVLHHREADEHDDQDETADQGRLDEVAADLSGDGEARSHDPDEEEEPGRYEKDRAVVAVMNGEIDDQQQADAGDGGDGDAGNAGRYRRIEDRKGRRGQRERRARRTPRGRSAHASG